MAQQDNWWGADQVADAPAPARGGPIYGAPPRADKPPEPKTTYRPLSPDEIRQRNLNPSHAWQISSEGNVDDLGDTSPKPKESKALREGDATQLRNAGGTLSTLQGLLGGFRDDYAGNTLTGGLENTLQSLNSGIGTEGQRDWWSNMANVDNIVRNGQFGASLTPGEKAEFEKTTISPRMDPKIIRQNLTRREEILRNAVARQVAGMKAAGWNADEMDAYVGQQIGWKPDGATGGKDDREKAAAIREPKMVGGLPVGSTPEFGMDKTDKAFDRDAYLRDNYGISPDQESQIIAFWNANSGNPGLSPDGVKQWYAKAGVTPPSDADIATLITDAKKGRDFTGFDTTGAEAAYRAKLQTAGDANSIIGADTATGAFVNHAANDALFGMGDELSGAQDAVTAAIRGDNPVNAYRFGRDVVRQQIDEGQQAHPWLSAAGSLAGGVVGSGVVGGLRTGANAPRTIASLAKEGAGLGAAYGFGNGEGAGGSILGTATGAALGGAMGAGAGKVSDMLTARAMRPVTPSEAAQNLQAGEKYGLNLSLGDVGGRGAKMVERSLDAQPAAAEIMNAPRRALTDEIEGAVGNVADKFGDPTSFRGMGEAAQSGANRWIDKFNGVVGKLYDRIPVGGRTEAVIDSTRAALANLSNKIGSNPELSDLLSNPRFARYLDALTPVEKPGKIMGILPSGQMEQIGGKLSWQDLKAFRSDIGEQLGEALFTDGTRKGELRALYSALSTDMEATAAAQGPKALAAFQRANDTFAAGQKRIEGAITQLLGNDKGAPPEKAAALIQRLAQEGKGSADLARLTEIKRTMRPEEWGQLSNGLIRLLGQPANAEGRAFSAQTFIRNFDTMSPEAKNMLFGADGKALRSSLDEFAGVLRKVAENDSTRNTSGSAFGLGAAMTNTAGAGAGATIGMALGGPVGAAIGSVLGIGASHAMNASMAKLWTNPVFVRWATGYAKLAAQPRDTAALTQQVQKLGRIAETQGAIAADARGLQDYLLQSLNQSPTRAAASEDEPNRGRVPPQQ